jgi:hypothetical protein
MDISTTPPTSSKYERESAPALSSGTLAKAAGCQWYSGGSFKLAALARDTVAVPGNCEIGPTYGISLALGEQPIAPPSCDLFVREQTRATRK